MRIRGMGWAVVLSTALASGAFADEAGAIAALEKIGAKVRRDMQLVGKPVVAVYLDGTKVTDADLKHLAEFKRLGVLQLDKTGITGEGFKELQGLEDLHWLTLSHTKTSDKSLIHLRVLHLQDTPVTNEGLKELKELRSLERLVLTATKVTDAGLAQLQNLKSLKELYFNQTEVTDEGVKNLKTALPNCRIYR